MGHCSDEENYEKNCQKEDGCMSLMAAMKRYRQAVHNSIQLKRVKQAGQNNVFGRIDIVNPKKLSIGRDCSFNHGAYINAFNSISLGNDVTVSAGAKIIATGIDYIAWSEGNKRHIADAEIDIGNHVWIGANAQILAGVHIFGEYVVIAAGAVLTESITESRVIVAGCPAKIIKRF
jgi:acetyltransferase-like isoleucine patch superfamily enzyme